MARGDVIRAARQARGWGIRQAAAEAGVATATWSGVELGQTNPQSETLSKICEVLDLALVDLERSSSTLRLRTADWNGDLPDLIVDGGEAPEREVLDSLRSVLESPWNWWVEDRTGHIMGGRPNPEPGDDLLLGEIMAAAHAVPKHWRAAALAMLHGLAR